MHAQRHLIAIAYLLHLAAVTAAAVWPPPGERVKAPVVRDTWISAYKDETDCNLGGADKMKTKGIQEFSIVDIDPVSLRGRVVTGATLHLHCRSKDAQPRLTVSTLASDWVEGTSKGYAKQAGSASFNWAEQDKTPWAWPGSDMTAVFNGMGNTLWRFADTTPPDAKGWQVVAVDPDVVAARVAGISYGFVFFDDVGSEYDRDGETFTYRIFPNRFVSSREAGAGRAPYLTVYLGDRDTAPPAAVGTISSSSADLAVDTVQVRWTTPVDSGPAGVIGFDVRVSVGPDFDWNSAKPIPRYLIPMAGKPGAGVVMDLRTSEIPVTGRAIIVGVRAIDRAGNMGPVRTGDVQLPTPSKPVTLPGKAVEPFTEGAPLPRIANADVSIVDPLDKVAPDTGKTIPSRSQDYRCANHLWSARERRVRLFAARNEFVAFQVVVSGEVTDLGVELNFTGTGPRPSVELRKFRYVASGKELVPDPLVSVEGGISVPDPDAGVAGQTHASLVADVYVPRNARPGVHSGTLRLTAGGQVLDLDIDLTVWDFTLPNRLSFIPQMNAYSRVPEPEHERDYYRDRKSTVAQVHRTCLNILTYGWNGHISDNRAPRWDGDRFEWTDYDRRFGPLLDGSAFADLPRGAVPVEAFYLPFNENWPLDIHKAFMGGYWIEDAMAPDYRPRFAAACRQFAEHVRDRGWTETMFEFYLNNKVYHKKDRWSRSAAPWVFDEPVNTQDFWALRWYGTAFQEAVSGVRDSVKMLYRCDLSRPEWQRDILDGVLDVNVCGGAFHRYARFVLERKRRFGEVAYNYGAANKLDTSNVQPAAWCIDTWCRGLDGVLPWQTLGRDKSWQEADQLSLFYPGTAIGQPGPHPSVRLKSFRRGQQDVEYLTILADELDHPRARDDVAATVLDTLRLKPAFSQAYAEDAGVVSFHDLDPVHLWQLRVHVGATLNRLKPDARDRLVEYRPPRRDVNTLPNMGYARVSPPRAGRPAATGSTDLSVDDKMVTVQGKPAVRDAVIHFEQPDQALGRTPRDNRLVRQNEGNALLVRFDLTAVPANATVKQATMSVFVWDPSNRGKTRLCVYPVTGGDWDEDTVTWNQRKQGAAWSEGSFRIGADSASKAIAEAVIMPDAGSDIANPPVEYRLDITEAVKVWLGGRFPNHGMALCPIVDRKVDDGHWSRLQVFCSEHGDRKHTPKLVVRFAQ